jgi:hypothetical protein
MSAGKIVEAVGVLAKVETTYGTDSTPAASTDGVQIIKPRPSSQPQFMFDGVRGLQNGGFANVANAPKRGRWGEFTIQCEAKGNGSDYTSSAVLVPHIHALLRMAGYTGAYTTAPNLWTFTPTAAGTAPTSGTVWLYGGGEVHKYTGVYASLKITAGNIGIPIFEFSCRGIMGTDPADIALASITYHDATVIPPAATAVTFEWGDLTAPVLRSMEFDCRRNLDFPRANQVGTDGHSGFSPGSRDPIINLLMEATALATGDFSDTATIDPYNLTQNSTLAQDFAYTCGGTQYNRWKLAAAATQAHTVEVVDEGPVQLWRIGARPYTDQTSAADHTIVFS